MLMSGDCRIAAEAACSGANALLTHLTPVTAWAFDQFRGLVEVVVRRIVSRVNFRSCDRSVASKLGGRTGFSTGCEEGLVASLPLDETAFDSARGEHGGV